MNYSLLSIALSASVLVASPALAAPQGSVALDAESFAVVEGGLNSNNQGDRFGLQIEAGDINGDGFQDLVVGAPVTDSVYLFLGPVSGAGLNLSDADAFFKGLPGGEAGWSLAVGDLNNDGRDDILLSEVSALSGAGLVHALQWPLQPHDYYLAPLDLTSRANSYLVSFAGPTQANGAAYAGWDLAIDDFDGDGQNDVLIGACGAVDEDPELGDPKRRPLGAAYFVSQKDFVYGASMLLKQMATTTFVGVGNTGCAVGSAGDFNNDGVNDMLLGSYGVSSAASGGALGNSGAAHIVYGAAHSGTVRLASYGEGGSVLATVPNVATVIGELRGGNLGSTVAGIGDVNGDGFDDVALAAAAEYCVSASAGACANRTRAGRVHLMLGGPGLEGQAFVSQVQAGEIVGADLSSLGREMARASDLDQDGMADFLIGSASGEAYLFYGVDDASVTANYDCFSANCSVMFGGSLPGLMGSLTTEDAAATFVGPDATDYAGLAVRHVGDIDGDGVDDLAFGAPGEAFFNSTSSSPGLVYMVSAN